MKRLLLLATVAGFALPGVACAYTPQIFNPAVDKGIDFSTIPANSSLSTIRSDLAAVGMGNFWGNGSNYYADGKSLWITSSASSGWPSAGFMSTPTGCGAGFGYGHFHWRHQTGYNAGQATQGPGANSIMWPADNDPNWPGAGGTAKGSQNDTHIGEVDVYETSYGDNNQGFATFHYKDLSGKGQQIMASPMIYPSGQSPNTMNDYDVYWSAGSLIEYVDNILQHSAPSAQVPADYAHGGCNMTLGAQMAMQATAYDKLPTGQFLLANMWWDPSTSPSGGTGGGGTVTPNSLTLATPSGSYTAGTAFSLTATEYFNGTAPTSFYLIDNSGNPASVTPSVSGTTLTFTVPASLVASGANSLILETTDGKTISNTVNYTAASAGGGPVAASGSVPVISPLYAGAQNVPVTLNSAVTNAYVVWRTSGTPNVGDDDEVAVSGIGGSAPFAPGVTIDNPGRSSTLWLSINNAPFVKQWSATPTTQAVVTESLTLDSIGPFNKGTSCNITGGNNFATGDLTVNVNGSSVGTTTPNLTGTTAGSTYSAPCPSAVTATAGSESLQVVSADGTTSNTVSVTINSPQIAINTASEPSPFYTGRAYTLTGTNGQTGVQISHNSGGAASPYTTANGWLPVTVDAQGNWSGSISIDRAVSQHIYGVNPGGTPVDLFDPTGVAPPATDTLTLSAVPAGTLYAGEAWSNSPQALVQFTANYVPANLHLVLDGTDVGAAVTQPDPVRGTDVLLPAFMTVASHTISLVDGSNATSNQQSFRVYYEPATLQADIDYEMASSDSVAVQKTNIDSFIAMYQASEPYN